MVASLPVGPSKGIHRLRVLRMLKNGGTTAFELIMSAAKCHLVCFERSGRCTDDALAEGRVCISSEHQLWREGYKADGIPVGWHSSEVGPYVLPSDSTRPRFSRGAPSDARFLAGREEGPRLHRHTEARRRG